MMQPQRLPLLTYPQNRYGTTSVDSKIVNGFVEISGPKEDQQLWVYKRPGLSGTVVGTGTAQGVYNWQGKVYSIFGGTFYENGVSKGTVNASGMYTFSSTLGATPKLFFKNTTNAYVYSGGTITAISSVNYPATTCMGQAYLDGTTYVMVPATSNIQGSALNDATTWDPLNSIIAQIEPDAGVALSKQLVYVVALKLYSTEIFYDAGNATGSPLGTVAGSKISIGCIAPNSVKELGGALLWVGQTKEGSVCVVKLEDLKAQIVSTPAVERLLEQAIPSPSVAAYGWCLRIGGHRFYGITIPSGNLTLVYDLSTGFWAQWTDTNGNYFPIVASAADSSNIEILQHYSSGQLSNALFTFYQDYSSNIPFDLYTPNYDGGTRLRKLLYRMDVIADQQSSGTLSVSYSEDDYQTWTSAGTIDLTAQAPMLTDLGTFKRRAFHFSHSANAPLRLQGIELIMDLGSL